MSDAVSVSPLRAVSSALSHIVADAAKSVVAVRAQRARSSGFVWRPGLIVTAEEALGEEADVEVVLPGGERVSATVAGRDPATDVALLRVDRADVSPLALTTRAMMTGELVLSVGSRDGAAVAGMGLVALTAGPWRSLRGGDLDARIELGISLQRHAEGGLVLDADGHAFGMAVFGPRRRVLVIPAATIDRVASTLERHGRIPRGYLGLGLQPVRVEADGSVGAMVMNVDANGPGAAAGIQQGDVIVRLNQQPLAGVQALLKALGSDSVGSDLQLAVRRAGKSKDVRLTVGERPHS